VGSNSGKSDTDNRHSHNSSSFSGKDFFDKTTEWKKRVDEKTKDKYKDVNDKDLQYCTFHPSIVINSGNLESILSNEKLN